jgi:hypothetical protein
VDDKDLAIMHDKHVVQQQMLQVRHKELKTKFQTLQEEWSQNHRCEHHGKRRKKGKRRVSPEKHSYLIDLIDTETNRWGKCVFQSECPHGMQEWAEYLASRGDLEVTDPITGEKFLMAHPQVMGVDARAAAHIPIVDPV